MRLNILGVEVDKTTKKEVLSRISYFLNNKKKFYIVTPNPEIVLAASRNPKFAEILNSADISLPDGVGLKLADPSLKIIKGREIALDIFDLARKYGLKIFLLGATPAVNKRATAYAQEKYPNLVVCGMSGPLIDEQAEPNNDRELAREKKAIEKINDFRPDILFVAFGAPKQEFWVNNWKDKLKVGGIVVVGGTFDYLVGATAPKIMVSLGLEWLWRLIKEPKRLGRIVNAVIVFPLILLRSKLKA